MSRVKAELTADVARRVFTINESGDLCWAIDRPGKVKAGDIAGSMGVNYRYVTFGGRSYLVHRVVWLMSCGSWPDGEIDHINRIKTDNRIENLRCVPRAENMQNASGDIGFQVRGGRYRARISINGKTKYLGTYDSEDGARAAYYSAKRIHHAGARVNIGGPTDVDYLLSESRPPKPTKSSSGFVGVRINKKTGRFSARVSIGGRWRHVGTFDTAEEAVSARESAIISAGLSRRI